MAWWMALIVTAMLVVVGYIAIWLFRSGRRAHYARAVPIGRIFVFTIGLALLQFGLRWGWRGEIDPSEPVRMAASFALFVICTLIWFAGYLTGRRKRAKRGIGMSNR